VAALILQEILEPPSLHIALLEEIGPQAQGPGAAAESFVRLDVIDGPLVRLARVAPRVGEPVELRVTTAFAATTVELDLAGSRVALASPDGIEWRGTWTPEDVGTARGHAVVDGDELGPVELEVGRASE
ncbi:MAG: hypothetical protein P1P87_16435, partial [Trueperaceae bacterium]|nr:hypothetical protein [Trueperaceae bacterium]